MVFHGLHNAQNFSHRSTLEIILFIPAGSFPQLSQLLEKDFMVFSEPPESNAKTSQSAALGDRRCVLVLCET